MTGTPPRVAVTGAAGFIGSHVAEALLGRGHAVVGIDHCAVDADAARRNLAPLLAHPMFLLVRGDLAKIALAPLLDGVDTVFHLAARPGVRTSWGEEFADYVTSNVFATERLMQAARAAGVRRVVTSSSSSVYGTAQDGRLREEDMVSPMSPYGVSKLAAEQLTLLHARRPGTSVSGVALRYFTVYGPRQRPDMLIGRLLHSAATGEPLTVYGGGRQRRDFTFVGDVVLANLAAAEADLQAAAVNIGTGATVSVLELCDLVADVVGRPPVLRHEGPQDGDMPFTRAEVTRAAELLGHRSTVDLRTGLALQWTWLRRELRLPVTQTAG